MGAPGTPLSPADQAAFDEALRARNISWASNGTGYYGSQGNPNSFLDQLGSGHPINAVTGLAKSPGYDTAAQGAKEAQQYLQQLSQTAWDRQMQGLQGALGQFQGYDALKAQLIPSHAAQGGGGSRGPMVPPSVGPAIESRSGAGHFGAGNGISGAGYMPPVPPGGIPGAPAALPPPGADSPPPLPPPTSGPAPLPPPGSPIGSPAALPPPGPPNILTMLSTMTRGGRGHF